MISYQAHLTPPIWICSSAVPLAEQIYAWTEENKSNTWISGILKYNINNIEIFEPKSLLRKKKNINKNDLIIANKNCNIMHIIMNWNKDLTTCPSCNLLHPKICNYKKCFWLNKNTAMFRQMVLPFLKFDKTLTVS